MKEIPGRPSLRINAGEPHTNVFDSANAEQLDYQSAAEPKATKPVTERVWTVAVVLLCGPAIGYVVAHALLWLRSL
jgi:hypothetical protein